LLLSVTNLTVIYDRAMVINDLSFTVNEGELVSLVGPNGAGKSTLLRAITGLVTWEKEVLRKTTGGDVTLKGEVVFNGQHIEDAPAHDIVKKGLIHCPERRRPFREMTVLENLMAGAYLVKDKAEVDSKLGEVYKLFPVLLTRSSQISGPYPGENSRCLRSDAHLCAAPSCFVSTNHQPVLHR